MTKTQLLTDLSGKSFVDSVGTPELLNTTNGVKWYRVVIHEVVEKSMTVRSIDFYVLSEGEVEEVAYYKDSEPKQTVQATEE